MARFFLLSSFILVLNPCNLPTANSAGTTNYTQQGILAGTLPDIAASLRSGEVSAFTR